MGLPLACRAFWNLYQYHLAKAVSVGMGSALFQCGRYWSQRFSSLVAAFTGVSDEPGTVARKSRHAFNGEVDCSGNSPGSGLFLVPRRADTIPTQRVFSLSVATRQELRNRSRQSLEKILGEGKKNPICAKSLISPTFERQTNSAHVSDEDALAAFSRWPWSFRRGSTLPEVGCLRC